VTVKKFLELKHARDILLDPKKKEDYDKKISQELLAKKKQREREAELDEKRRRMRDGCTIICDFCITTINFSHLINIELLRKEKSVEERTRDRSVYKKSDLSKFREKGLAQQEALREKLARDARRREELRSYQASAISGGTIDINFENIYLVFKRTSKKISKNSYFQMG
jgi:curved DNA-binding protein CbpA